MEHISYPWFLSVAYISTKQYDFIGQYAIDELHVWNRFPFRKLFHFSGGAWQPHRVVKVPLCDIIIYFLTDRHITIIVACQGCKSSWWFSHITQQLSRLSGETTGTYGTVILSFKVFFIVIKKHFSTASDRLAGEKVVEIRCVSPLI